MTTLLNPGRRPCARPIALAALLLAGAATPTAALAEGRPILSIDGGPGTARRYGDFTIVAVESREVSIPRGRHTLWGWEGTETLDMPSRALLAMPVLSGWTLSYGFRDDHHLGTAWADVAVERFDQRTRRVTIKLTAKLADWNEDDRWEGRIQYHIFYLGPAATPEIGPEQQ